MSELAAELDMTETDRELILNNNPPRRARREEPLQSVISRFKKYCESSNLYIYEDDKFSREPDYVKKIIDGWERKNKYRWKVITHPGSKNVGNKYENYLYFDTIILNVNKAVR